MKSSPQPSWDQPATLIDLDGTAPLIADLRECIRHFAALKPSAKDVHRILLTQPTPQNDRPTRTWILNPEDIEALGEEASAD
jgi:hypothetical protein